MTQKLSSSNRVTEISDSVLMKDQRALGPIRLPVNRADDFIDHFNRIYEGLGIKLAPSVAEPHEETPVAEPHEETPLAEPNEEASASEPNKKIPDSLKAAGDDDSG